MGPEDAAYAVSFLKPKVVVPVHYNTFPVIEQDPNNFAEMVSITEVKVLNPGEELEI